MDQRKRGLIISLVGIAIILIFLVGLTYGYFQTRIKGNEKTEYAQDITSKELSIVYADGSSTFVPDVDIILPGYTATKTFTVSNTGDDKAYFSIILDNMTNTFHRNHDLRYRLSKNAVYDEATESNKVEGYLAVGTHQILMPKAYVDKGELATFYLEIEYENSTTENQSEDMGKKLEFRVNITEEAVTWDDPSTPSWESSGTVSLISAIKRDNPNILTQPSIVYNSATAYSGGEIVSMEDDYGTSYFYRGNPTNNYVTYSNMCWRIVRVQGDGTIKLILTDKEKACSSSTMDTFSNNSYIGEVAAWFSSAAWYNDSFYPQFVDNAVFRAGEDFSRRINKHLLTPTDWCMDGAKDYETSTWDSYSYNRIYTTKEYTLKCNREGLDEINSRRWSKYTYALSDMYVGAITIDEAILGGININYATKSYLSSSTGYLTMTPSWLYNKNEIRWHRINVVNTTNKTSRVGEHVGGFSDYYIPMIILKNNVIILSGNGTRENPYVVY